MFKDKKEQLGKPDQVSKKCANIIADERAKKAYKFVKSLKQKL